MIDVSRFYVDPENVQNNEIFIEGREAKHILAVMRLKEGDMVVVFDGTGEEYTGFIKKADKKHRDLTVEIIKRIRPLANKVPEIDLAQAIPKKEKMDYILEKATELGVSSIIPIITSRTIVRLDGPSALKKNIRWQKIAMAAAKQCGRVVTPEVKSIVSFKELLSSLDSYDICLFATLHDPTVPIRSVLNEFHGRRILVLIGPEGGFTSDEIKQVDTMNCRFVSLGNNVFKSDTAGLFVLSVINYEFSDLST